MRRAVLPVLLLLASSCSSPEPSVEANNGENNGAADSGSLDAADAGADSGSSGDLGPDLAAADLGADVAVADAAADAGGADVQTSDVGPDAEATARHRGTCGPDDPCGRPEWSCITIPANEPDGYHTCQVAEAAEPSCQTIEAPDQCCMHSDCGDDPSGTCVTGPIFYCGGAFPQFANVCMYDQCVADSDCGDGEICIPPRVLAEPVARCVPVGCTLDADCDARPGGECTAFFEICNGRFAGFHCTYDDSECRTNSDCSNMGGNGTPFCARTGVHGVTECGFYLPPP